jgi:putative SOS response-associated peptidase YedK
VEPSYNVAPSHLVPIVVTNASGSQPQAPGRLLQLCQWGLVPFWVKDLKGAKPVINARAESLTEKTAFKDAFVKRRCIIPADGFYEWKKDKRGKVPVRIRLQDEKLFGFAGIYQDWRSPDGSKMRTFAIITVPASDAMKNIHDRMPAILTRESEGIWLDPHVEDEDALSRCLEPYPYDDLEAYVVSTMVNKPDANSPELIAEVPGIPVEEPEDDDQPRQLKIQF